MEVKNVLLRFLDFDSIQKNSFYKYDFFYASGVQTGRKRALFVVLNASVNQIM